MARGSGKAIAELAQLVFETGRDNLKASEKVLEKLESHDAVLRDVRGMVARLLYPPKHQRRGPKRKP